MSAGPLNPRAEIKDYFALRHFRHYILTSEIPQISTSRPQTPDKGMGTLKGVSAKTALPQNF